MSEAIRELKKQGARNREINESIREAMKLIEENRKKKKEEEKQLKLKKDE
jgi:hypothetical protein